MDRHVIAAISIAGVSLDFLGGMYLAYDLLGGKHGPLRTLTRAVTYGLLFAASFGFTLGLIFGIATGITHGITLALEFARGARQERPYSFAYEVFFSFIRAVGLGVGTYFIFGLRCAVTFALLSTLGQAVGYTRAIR